MTTTEGNESKLNSMKGVSVFDAETQEMLFEFIPAMTMVKVVTRGKLFLVDVQQLAALHKRGVRAATANPVSKIKRLVEPVGWADEEKTG